MYLKKKLRDERGIALVLTILISVAVAALVAAAYMMGGTTRIIGRYNERVSSLESVAEAGVERGRSAINGNKLLYPDSLYNTLENGVSVTDAAGNPIPNVRRYTYVGPTGITTGQYGVFGSIVSVAEDDFGNRVIRRGEVRQESFAKYAYFTTIEGNIWFASGDQIWGPVHSNDRIQIYSTGAWFHSDVTTGRDIYQPYYGTFDLGYTEWAPTIPMPTTADLTKLRVQGQAGNTAFTGNTSGGAGEASTRIQFIAIDLNGDGDDTDPNEGFIRVYQHLTNANWVSGDVPSDYGSKQLQNSKNCGDWAGGTFMVADDHPGLAPHAHSWLTSVTSSGRRCYLGGADEIWGGFDAGPDAMGGRWLAWTGGAIGAVAGRPDDGYLFPISRELNPNFKGVIFVDGKVLISGVLRGRVTVAATDEIVIGDDMRYATDPGLGTCQDMMGMFSGKDVVIADNTLNAPIIPEGGYDYRTYDETSDEFIHGVVLALDNFTVENYSSGSTNDEYCQGTKSGRGCIFLTGGIIQKQRGAVGLTDGHGYVKRYSYDSCVLEEPPPYFPTTGHFARGRIFEIDPTGFNVLDFYRLLTP